MIGGQQSPKDCRGLIEEIRKLPKFRWSAVGFRRLGTSPKIGNPNQTTREWGDPHITGVGIRVASLKDTLSWLHIHYVVDVKLKHLADLMDLNMDANANIWTSLLDS